MTLSRPFAAALLAVPFFAASPSVLPARADSFTVTDVLGAQGGAMSVTIPEIQVVDGNMSEADIRALFEGGDPAAMAATLSSWDAASLTIPEFRYSQVMKVPDQPDVTVESVYRNLTIEGLQDGVAQSSRLDGGDFKSSGAEGVNGTFGTLTTGRIDFAAIVGFYAGGGGEMKTIYSDVAFEGATLSGPQGFACDIGRMTTGEFRARPLQTSFVELMTMAESMEGMQGAQKPSPAELHWDEATETITIDEVSTGGVDMGTVSFTAVLGNAGKGLFAEDPMAMQASAMGLSVKQVSVSADDDGLAQRLFAMVGKEQGQEPGAVRTQVSGMAAGMIPMMMGGTEQAQQVANAVMTFLNGGTSLKITAIAKEAAGLGLMEFMAAQENPAALAEKVDLSAEAK